MGITINNMTCDQVNKACKAESKWLKLGKLLSAFIVALTAIICMSYFAVGHKSVNALQDNCSSLLPATEVIYCLNSTIYDFNFQAGPFSDEVAAKEYNRLLKNCDA